MGGRLGCMVIGLVSLGACGTPSETRLPVAGPTTGEFVVLSGTLRDAATGAGIPDARVEAGPEQHGEVDCTLPPRPPFGEARSGPDGSFRVGPLPPGARLRLRCEAAGHVPRVVTEGFEEIALSRGVRLTGVVRDSSGRPVEGAEVAAGLQSDGSEDGADSPLPVKTGRDGRYAIDGLAPGRTYGLSVGKPGVGTTFVEDPIEVPDDATEGLARDLVLLRPVTVTIRVLDPDGRPVEDADVKVDSPGALCMGTTRAGRGSISFEVQPGRLAVKVANPRFAPADLEVEAVEGMPLDLPVVLRPAPR